MYQSDREAVIEFVRGACFIVLVLTVGLGFIWALNRPEHEAAAKFEVVDKYKGCDVVRYTTKFNNWEYFLDCTDRN